MTDRYIFTGKTVVYMPDASRFGAVQVKPAQVAVGTATSGFNADKAETARYACTYGIICPIRIPRILSNT